MARREYPPPLKIENLSTGIDPTLVDDFTGELLPQPEAKPLASAQDLIDQANMAKVAKAKLTLERVGILKPTVSVPTPKPRTRLMIKLKPKDWRRM